MGIGIGVGIGSGGSGGDATAAPASGIPKQFRFVTYGDSKSVLMGNISPACSSLRWAMMMYPINYEFNFQQDNTGVYGKHVQTQAGELADDAVLAPMLARFAAGQNVLIFKGFTNDTGLPFDQDMAAFRKIHLKAKAAGCQLMIVMGLNPLLSNDANTAAKYESIDQALRQYERANDDVWYIPTTLSLLDVTSRSRLPIVSPIPVMADGTHENNTGAYLEGRALADELARRGVPRRGIQTISPADSTQRYNAPVGNFHGANGTFNQIGNSAGVTIGNSGSGTITGQSNWPGVDDTGYCRLNGQLTGSVSLDISMAPCAALNKLGNRVDVLRPRLTVSGTTGSEPTRIQVDIYSNIYNNAGGPLPNGTLLEAEFAWQANALIGLDHYNGVGSVDDGTLSAQALCQIDGFMHEFSPKTFINEDPSLGCFQGGYNGAWVFNPNTVVGGSIDLIAVGQRQIYPLQPAAA